MTVQDAVKISKTPIGLAKKSVEAADSLIASGESVLHAIVANYTISGAMKLNGAVVVTSHRILFCNSTLGKVNSVSMKYADCVGLGSISGVTMFKTTISCDGTSAEIELGRKSQLQALQQAILDAIEDYPNQCSIQSTADSGMPTTNKILTEQRIKENKAAGVACCPKCGSASLSGNKKGFGAGKAAIGMIAVGPAGALAGGLGSRKVEVTCLNCGYKFKPGK